MIRVDATPRSLGARALARALGGTVGPADGADPCVRWRGATGARWAINAGARLDKRSELATLRAAGVDVPDVVDAIGACALWLPRTRAHREGRDLAAHARADYWTRWEPLAREWRAHVCRDRTFRAGLKYRDPALALIDRPAAIPVRSRGAGWRITYRAAALDGARADRSAIRAIGVAACAALALDLAAVDVGEREDGSLLVLEVNTAPGLSADCAASYARALRAAGLVP